jgi:hypothetical protein
MALIAVETMLVTITFPKFEFSRISKDYVVNQGRSWCSRESVILILKNQMRFE